MRAIASASAEMSAASTAISGYAIAAITARLPLPVHRSSTRRVRSESQASSVPVSSPSTSSSAMYERGTIARSSIVNGTFCSQASPVR